MHIILFMVSMISRERMYIGLESVIAHYRTFSIGNPILESELKFLQTYIFQIKCHIGFLFYFAFPFKK